MPRYTVLYESFELKEQLRIRSATAPALLDSKFVILRKHLSPPSDAKSSQLTPTEAHSCSSQGHPCLAGADGPPELLAMGPCTKKLLSSTTSPALPLSRFPRVEGSFAHVPSYGQFSNPPSIAHVLMAGSLSTNASTRNLRICIFTCRYCPRVGV